MDKPMNSRWSVTIYRQLLMDNIHLTCPGCFIILFQFCTCTVQGVLLEYFSLFNINKLILLIFDQLDSRQAVQSCKFNDVLKPIAGLVIIQDMKGAFICGKWWVLLKS